LCLSRPEIASYAKANDIPYLDDSSNADLFTQRNILRHKIIPYLKENLDLKIDENISRIIHNLSLYHELFEERLKEAVTNSVKRSGKRILLNRKRYLNYNEAVKRGLLEYCISNLYPVNYKVSDRNFLIWDEFVLNAQPGKKKSFLEDGMAIAERNQIVFGEIPEDRPESYSLDLRKPAVVNNRFMITVTRVKASEVLISHDRNVEFIDGDKSTMPLSVRYWQKGDRFRPLGMNHRRKLSDFFTDLKLGTASKKNTPIVCNNDQIIWIAGYRLDDYYKIRDDTKLFYKLELKEI
jgi:tRNA(Ile)-lysidine synthase